MRAIVTYALLRGVFFLAPFAILIAAQVPWYWALLVALLFAFAASAVFLRRQKVAVGEEIGRMRTARGERDDEDVEDEADDATRVDESATEAGNDAASADAVDGSVATTAVDPDLSTDEQVDADASAPDASDDRDR